MLIHPGEILGEDFLKDYELSQRATAKKLGVSPRTINEIVAGRRGITAEMSLRLGKLFGQSDRFWLNLQQEYDMRVVRSKVDLSGVDSLA